VNWHRPGMYKKFLAERQPSSVPALKSGNPGGRETGAAAVGVQLYALQRREQMVVCPKQ
jgi:hypothetical protein